jgi:hypothetical protein
MSQFTRFFAASAMLAVLGGCSVCDKMDGHDADKFNDADEVAAATRLMNQQIASGARTDATLRPYHFDNTALNSLGRAKLDSMLNDDDKDGEMVVYVDVPAGEGDADKKLASARQDSVTQYLMSRGRSEDTFRLESGFNPNNVMSVMSAKPAAGSSGAAPAGTSATSGYSPAPMAASTMK